MIRRLFNSFVPFLVILIALLVSIYYLDNYAANLSRQAEIIDIKNSKDNLGSNIWDFETDDEITIDKNKYQKDSLYIKANRLYKIGKWKEAKKILINLSERYPNKEGILNYIGLVYLKQNKNSQAIDFFEKSIQANPKYVPALLNAGISYTKRQQYQKAEEVYKKALEIQTTNAKVWLNLGILHIKREMWNQAVETLNKSIEFGSGKIKPKAYYYAGLAYANLKDTLHAKKMFNEAILLKPSYLLPRIQLSLLEKDTDKKIKLLKDIIRLNPDYSPAYYYLSMIYIEQNHFHLAEQQLQQALLKSPHNEDIINMLGTVYLKENKTAEAEKLFKELVKTDSLFPQNYFLMAKTYSEKGENQKALEFYDKAIKLANGHYPQAYLNKGLIYKRIGETNKAILAYQKAITQKKNYPEALYNVALLYQSKNKLELAKNNYRQAIKLKPDYIKAWYNLASLYDKINNSDSAIYAYKKAILIKPDYTKALLNLAIVLRKNKKFNEAILTYKTLLQYRPDYYVGWYNLGIAYEKSADTLAAIEAYQKSLQLVPDNIRVMKRIAELYQKQKNYDLAIEILNNAMNIDQKDNKLLEQAAEINILANNDVQAAYLLNKAIKLEPDKTKLYKELIALYDKQKKWEMAAVTGSKLFGLKQDEELAYEIARNFHKAKIFNKAEEWYQKSIELGRDKSWTYYWLGKLYVDTRKYESAVRFLSKALQKNNNHKFAHLRLAKTYEVLNKPDKAIKHYHEVLRIEPNNKNALKAIQNLKN